MKIHALLSWYEESPTFISACVASIAPHVDHVIAVDGAYQNFPDARAKSDRLQAETIMAICDAADIACTIHQPATPWRGNEVEKRNHLFKIASAFSEPFTDWYWVIDADCVVTSVPTDFRPLLKECEQWSIDVALWERRDYLGDVPEVARELVLPTHAANPLTCLFRVMKDMQVVGAHYVYGGFKPDGEWSYAWAPHFMHPEATLRVPEIQVEHRSIYRDKYRRDLSQMYYKIRDELGIERVVPRNGNGELGTIKVERS